MAYIKRFTIHGLAGRDEPISQELDRQINIFWGLNGAGKTSLLKILNSALRNETSLLKRVPFTAAEVVFKSTANNSTIKRTIINTSQQNDEDSDEDLPATSLEQVGEGLWREVQKPTEISWTTEVLSGRVIRPDASFQHTYLPISRMTRGTNSSRYRMSTMNSTSAIDDAYLDDDFAEQVRRKWQAYNADALASIRIIQQQGLASILALLFGGAAGPQKKLAGKVTANEAYKLVGNFLEEQSIRLRFGENEFVRRYEQETDLRGVVATIQEVAEEVEEATRPQRDFQNVIENLYSGEKRLFFDKGNPSRGSLHVEVGGLTIPLQSLSSGEKQLLRLMLETLAAEDGTVMIDEPELSMHVDWQQVLVASMVRVNPDCQLLLATHSPEVMADVPDKYVFQI